MPNNPFSSDYGGAPQTQAAVAPAALAQAVETKPATEQVAGINVDLGFEIKPIPMVSGKPRRVIIRGKVTRD